MKKSIKFFLLLALVVALPFGVFAEDVHGKLKVTVTGEDGDTVPGAIVKIEGAKIPLGRAVASNDDGVATFVLVPPGTYTVTVQMAGYATTTIEDVRMNIGSTTRIAAKVSLGGTEIVVSAGQQLMDTTSSTVGESIDYEFMDNLPNARTFQEVMNLLPGVLNGNNPSVNGSSSYDNAYLIDGTDTTDPRTQTWGAAINFDIIDQWELQTAGFKAEYGRATGGIVNLVTKTGTNDFHGGVRVVGKDVDWNEDSDLPVGTQGTEFRPSVWMSGPLIKDKLYYLWSYERRDREQTFTRYNFDNSIAGDDVSNYHGFYLSTKLTWDVNEKNRVNLYYQKDPIDITNVWGRYYNAFTLPSAENFQAQGGSFWNIRWSSILTDRLFFELFYSDYKGTIDFAPMNDNNLWSGFDLAFGTIYGNNFDAYFSKRDRKDFRGSLSFIQDTSFGTHNWKFGLEVVKLENSLFDNYYGIGTGNLILSFGDQWNFVDPTDPTYWVDEDQNGATDGVFDSVTGGDGTNGFALRIERIDQPGWLDTSNDIFALYIQDDWELNDNVTFNLGLRADSIDLNNNVGDEVLSFGLGDMIAPRLGFAWDITGEGRHKLHGNISRYYDMVTDYVTSALNVTDPILHKVYGYYGYWYYWYSYTTGDSNYIYGDLDPTYEDEIRIGYDWKLRNGHVLRFNLMYSEMNDAIEDVNLGLGTLGGPTMITGDQPYWDYTGAITYNGDMISGFDDNLVLNVNGTNVNNPYVGFEDGNVEIVNTPGNFKETTTFQVSYWKPRGESAWTLYANYSWTKSRGYGDSSLLDSYADTPMNVYNRWGRTSSDRPLHLKVAGTYYFPWWGLSASGSFQLVSGAPWAPYFRTRTGAGTGIEYLESRGNRRMPSTYTLNVKFSKLWDMDNFSVELYFDVFNLTDVQKPISIKSASVTSSNFFDALVLAGENPYANYQTPRAYQVGVSVKW